MKMNHEGAKDTKEERKRRYHTNFMWCCTEL